MYVGSFAGIVLVQEVVQSSLHEADLIGKGMRWIDGDGILSVGMPDKSVWIADCVSKLNSPKIHSSFPALSINFWASCVGYFFVFASL